MAGRRAAWGAADFGVAAGRRAVLLLVVWSGLLLSPLSGPILGATPEAADVAFLGGKGAVFPPLPRKRQATDGSGSLVELAEGAARRHGLQPELVHAIILAESLYDARALSHKGAMGLMQLMPATAQRYGVGDPWDPSDNIDGGVRYLRDLMRQFDDVSLALAAYNAGEEAVARYGNRVPPFAETMTYVERVKAFYDRLKAGGSVAKLKTQGIPGMGGSPRLSGWGVIFGALYDRAEARGLLRRQQSALRPVLRGGRPAVVRRSREDGDRFAALLVGLKQEDAAAACRHLRASGSYCKALSPAELTDPRALWR